MSLAALPTCHRGNYPNWSRQKILPNCALNSSNFMPKFVMSINKTHDYVSQFDFSVTSSKLIVIEYPHNLFTLGTKKKYI